MKFQVVALVAFLSCAGFWSAGAASNNEYSRESVLPPIGHTIFCQDYPGECSNREPSALFQLMNEGALYENLATVNRSVNSLIIPARESISETANDRWLVFPVSGNCHDFAVSKRHELLRMGWPSSALLLAEVVLKTGEHHLVLVADIRGKRFVLDNLTPSPVLMPHASGYSWLRMESDGNVRYWVKADNNK